MPKRNLSRREFMTMVAAVPAMAATGNILYGSESAKPLTPAALRNVKLGKSGITTTLLGIGTGFNGGNRSSNITRAGVAESLIRSAYEKGIRFFDCADSYGTHPYTKTALAGYQRDSYTLCTKIWMTGGGIPEPERPDADKVIERFRKELGTDYIDLVQIHCMTDGSWTDGQKRQMDILDTLKAKKIIKAHGVSVHSFDALNAAAESDWVDVIHVRINPFGDAMDKKDPSLIVPVIGKLHEKGKGVIGMKLIGNGAYRNDPAKIDESIRFVMGLGTVDMVIIGFENPGQIDDYILRMEKAINVK